MFEEVFAYDYDVFISYSSRDKAWVRNELLSRIESTGLMGLYRLPRLHAPRAEHQRDGAGRREVPQDAASPLARLHQQRVVRDRSRNGPDAQPGESRPSSASALKDAVRQAAAQIGALTHIDFTDGADHDLAWPGYASQPWVSLPSPNSPGSLRVKTGFWPILTPCRRTSPGCADEREMLAPGSMATLRIRCWCYKRRAASVECAGSAVAHA